MQPADFYRTLAPDRTLVEKLAFNPYYQPLGGLHQGQSQIQGRAYYDLASNDYLGLAADPRVREAMIAALREYGSSMCGTPIATGYARILAELEGALARFVGLEAALVFPSCYQANGSLFSAIATPRDLIIIDRDAHASLVEGSRAVGCKIRPFLHNDLAHLERQLAAAAAFRQAFVVTESVFSTEGSVAPFAAIVALCQHYQAIPVVDDSHGLGVLGKTGRGILEAEGIAPYQGIYTASLGKALAQCGGMVAGPRDFIEALRYHCPGFIYSTALPPVCLGGIRRTLDLLTEEFGRLSAQMWTNHHRLVARLRRRGFNLREGAAPIAAIHCGSAENTLALAKQLFLKQILATPFIPPSVPPRQGVLRLIVGAKLDEPGLQSVLDALEQVAVDTGP